jgi:hypothetical protein
MKCDLVLEAPMSNLDGDVLFYVLEAKRLGYAVQDKAQLEDCIGDERTPTSWSSPINGCPPLPFPTSANDNPINLWFRKHWILTYTLASNICCGLLISQRGSDRTWFLMMY